MTSARTFSARLRCAIAALWRLPVKLMFATMVVCVATREWYPLSPFPMFAAFGPSSWHVCVADDTGMALPTRAHFGLDAVPLRRMFESRVLARMAAGADRASAQAAAARELLSVLLREARPAEPRPALPARIHLWRTTSRAIDGRIAHEREMLGGTVIP
ncbi:MAG: hypothetical protein AB7V27_13435 [Candidatus Binatia bacterium]